LVINGPAVINIDFYTVDGQKIFQCLSRNSSKDNLILRKQGTIFCNFPKFPLLPGKYRINLWCKINEVIADQVNDALCLEVNSGDFFGTGKLNPDLKNGLLVEHNWNLN
jgi:lipopolysaccharide transport system ATP-binding protein